MNELEHFVHRVLSILACEHGASADDFDEYRPWIEVAFETEGQITKDELVTLCCGGEEEDPVTLKTVPQALEDKYPKLTQIFEAVFDGDEPFCLKCKKNTRMKEPHGKECVH